MRRHSYDLIELDIAEGFHIASLRTEKQQRLRGLVFVINNKALPDFLDTILLPPHPETRKMVEEKTGVVFTPLEQDPKHPRFGFNKGMTLLSRGDSETQIGLHFQQEQWPGFSFVANTNWLLDSLAHASYPEHDQRKSQLFLIHTMVSLEPRMHGFHLNVWVSKACADILETLVGTSFPLACQAIAEAYQWYHHYGKAEFMQVCVREKGIIHIAAGGDCNCLGMNPDERIEQNGYEMSSHNTDGPIHQIAILAGMVSIWEELRKHQAKHL